MELPKVYANPINKQLDNYQTIYQDRGTSNTTMDVSEYLNKLYKSGRIVYLINFIFNVDGVEFTDKIVSKTENMLMLKSNKKIPISSIKYIKEQKK